VPGGGACGLSGKDNNGNVVSQTIGIAVPAGTATFSLSYGYTDGLNRITSAGETNTNGTNAGLKSALVWYYLWREKPQAGTPAHNR